MKVVVVGATGHIGTYLVPRLVGAGHEVVAVSRGVSRPYHDDPAWGHVHRVEADREAEDARGAFAGRLVDLGADVVVDLVCFTADSARQLVEALRGRGTVLVHCGTIWVHGRSTVVPMGEDDDRDAYGEYGTAKRDIEDLLLEETRRGGLASTVLHPGHISGPGWPVITPAGNLDATVWQRLAAGEVLPLPGSGTETLHHVHADDVAQAFELAVARHDAARGRGFHVASPQAMTSRGLAAAAASWFGQQARVEQVSWERFAELTAPEHVAASRDHLERSTVASIARAQQVLGYAPRWSSPQAVREAVRWQVEHGHLDLGGRVP